MIRDVHGGKPRMFGQGPTGRQRNRDHLLSRRLTRRYHSGDDVGGHGIDQGRDQILTGREVRVQRCERHADIATQTTKSQRFEPLGVDDPNSGIHELLSSVLPRPNPHRRP